MINGRESIAKLSPFSFFMCTFPLRNGKVNWIVSNQMRCYHKIVCILPFLPILGGDKARCRLRRLHDLYVWNILRSRLLYRRHDSKFLTYFVCACFSESYWLIDCISTKKETRRIPSWHRFSNDLQKSYIMQSTLRTEIEVTFTEKHQISSW